MDNSIKGVCVQSPSPKAPESDSAPHFDAPGNHGGCAGSGRCPVSNLLRHVFNQEKERGHRLREPTFSMYYTAGRTIPTTFFRRHVYASCRRQNAPRNMQEFIKS